jgi:hypothetical protein
MRAAALVAELHAFEAAVEQAVDQHARECWTPTALSQYKAAERHFERVMQRFDYEGINFEQPP